jgi:phosphatidylglycerophosphatase A
MGVQNYTCSEHLVSCSLQSLESTLPQGRKVSPTLFGIHIFATGFSNTVINNEMKPSSINSIQTKINKGLGYVMN